ncbi:MAG: O-methyltransferase [Chitinophagaceae bacterium]|nr:O-methyltransferase [Chitinophagaceae bacterium]MCW5926637.1 O-methyltransferase [Chitinophagaceae bacterium]
MTETAIVNPLAEQYALQFTSGEDYLLNELAAFTTATHPKGHMLSGALQGKLLEMLTRMIQPHRVLEIGTFTGYSALCMAEGLGDDATLHTIEVREEDAATARSFFNKSPAKDKIHLHVGNALDIIPRLGGQWDMVFIDADKVSYIAYFEMVLPLLKPGGWIIADNVLFHGQVLEEEIKGKNAKAIHAFNEHIKDDNRVESVLLTVRDGLMLIRKK